MPDQPKNQVPTSVRRRRYVPTQFTVSPLSLTPVKVRMLRYLAELRFLSLPQLARLCCPAERADLSEKRTRRHMRALFDAGLVDVLPLSRLALAAPDASNDATLLHGSAPNLYALTLRGLELLQQMGIIDLEFPKRSLPSYGPRNSLFLAHELLVRDVRVWLEECARAGGHTIERWEDSEAAAIPLGGFGEMRFVRPDAWFAYRMGQTVLVGLVEADRGTELGDRRWREKLAAYERLYAGPTLREATGYINARVLVVCPDSRRRDALANFIATGSVNLAERFWLIEWDTLSHPHLSTPIWRRPGGTMLPLIPVE